MRYGFVKVAAASPKVIVADVHANADNICTLIERADAQKINLLVLPELCITGYTCGDLFYSETLLRAAEQALDTLAKFTKGKNPVVVLGTPIRANHKLYNCAAVLYDGEILALVPKSTPSNSGSLFISGAEANCPTKIHLGEHTVDFTQNALFTCKALPEFCFGVEVGEDFWMDSPAPKLCQLGATIIANPSASEEVVGKKEYRRLMVRSNSARMLCGYIHTNASCGESTQDRVFSQHNIISENGNILAENLPFSSDELIVSEIDVHRLVSERRKMTHYSQTLSAGQVCEYSFNQPFCDVELTRTYRKLPFVPASDALIAERAEDILRIQSYGLKKRIEHTRVKRLVIGISGGLDSCLALLVMARTMDLLDRNRQDIIAVSMPCFGTTKRTRSNAEKLCEQLGVTFREIDITASVRQHFADIGHDEAVRDVTYENSQARERTKVLMDIANDQGGLVVGTGDLSELALGWATYNGDHMSMYGVNAGVPKTLIRYIVRYEASRSGQALSEVLYDILDTPVSPELLPADDKGEIQQKTEDLVGPYELHDFFLYYLLRFGFSPKKIFYLAQHAFHDEYSDQVILKWLRTFSWRFFSQQFKRSCLPDGPKVGTVTLSPRGGWNMPSDASPALWIREIEELGG